MQRLILLIIQYQYPSNSIGMVRMPVLGDIDAARDPHLLMALHIVEEARQRRRPSRPPHQAAM